MTAVFGWLRQFARWQVPPVRPNPHVRVGQRPEASPETAMRNGIRISDLRRSLAMSESVARIEDLIGVANVITQTAGPLQAEATAFIDRAMQKIERLRDAAGMAVEWDRPSCANIKMIIEPWRVDEHGNMCRAIYAK
jgi:hypothetical protein